MIGSSGKGPCFLFTEYPGKQDFLQFADKWLACECLQETGGSPYNLPVIFGRARGGLSCFQTRNQAIRQDEQDLQESVPKPPNGRRMFDTLQQSLIKCMRQLFGVRWPGSALAGRDLSRPRLLKLIQRCGAESPLAKAAPGRRTPRS